MQNQKFPKILKIINSFIIINITYHKNKQIKYSQVAQNYPDSNTENQIVIF